MSDRMGEDARLDVYCCLNCFEVDPIQCVSWESHIILANRTNRLPVRLLDEAEIVGGHVSVSARDATRGSVSFDGTQEEAFQLVLAAIKDSDLKRFTLWDPIDEPISDAEVERIAADAETVKVAELRLWCDLRHLSEHSLHRLRFGFARVEELRLGAISGNQLTNAHLHECGRRKIWNFFVHSAADARPVAVSDEAVLEFLFAPENGVSRRELFLPAFNAIPQFVQKLVKRAQQAMNIGKIRLNIIELPARSQQFDGLRLTEREGYPAEYKEHDDNGILTFSFNNTDVFSFYVANYR